MKRTIPMLSFFLITIVALGCSDSRVSEPTIDVTDGGAIVKPELAAAQILLRAGWSLAEGQTLPANAAERMSIIDEFERSEVAPGIAHYSWILRVGFDPHDSIRIHRVVKEQRPWRPIRTRKAIFLQHGDAKDFVGMFLPGLLSGTLPNDFGAAVFWARSDVDVWGIDQAWNLVPAETTEFDFMADWGIDKQSRDLGTAIAISRVVRLLTGNGYAKMILLGYSSGSATGYALINAETQRPAGLRQVGGWIPVDFSPVSDNVEWNQTFFCFYIPDYQAQYDSGEYGLSFGFDFMGNLARDDPEGDSPVFPGFTNLQAAMYLGAGPIFGVGGIHYLAGIWEDDMPVDFQFLTVDQWLDFMIAGTPWAPLRFILDYSIWGCMETDVPWDDHFAEITIPVLNVAAAGGIGPTTHWCLGLLGSADISELNIQLRPDDEALYDFGHIDLWMANNAQQLVWEPLLQWIVAHSGQGSRDMEYVLGD